MSTSGGEIIKLEFTFHGQTQSIHQLGNASDGDDARDVNTRYSGRHDHGLLPELRSTGPMAQVVEELGKSKRISDLFLTQCIEKEAAMTSGVLTEPEGIEIEVDQEAPSAASDSKKRGRS